MEGDDDSVADDDDDDDDADMMIMIMMMMIMMTMMMIMMMTMMMMMMTMVMMTNSYMLENLSRIEFNHTIGLLDTVEVQLISVQKFLQSFKGNPSLKMKRNKDY